MHLSFMLYVMLNTLKEITSLTLERRVRGVDLSYHIFTWEFFLGIIPSQIKCLSNPFDDDAILDMSETSDHEETITIPFYPLSE